MLQSLGTGLGLAAVDTDKFGSLRSAGIGTGIWSLIAPLIAMFLGALLAGRLCGSRERGVGALHGAVAWSLSVIVGLWAAASVVSSLAGGISSLGGAATKAVSSADVGDTMSSLGIDTNDLLGPINQKLQAQGKPPVTSQQLDATIRGIAKRGVRQGHVDRQVVVDELARNTDMSRQDAEDIAGQVSDRVSRAGDKVERQAKEAALQAADKTGKALLFGGVMLLLSLGAALGGGALGVRSRTRDDDLYRTTRTPVVPPPEPPPPASHTIIEP